MNLIPNYLSVGAARKPNEEKMSRQKNNRKIHTELTNIKIRSGKENTYLCVCMWVNAISKYMRYRKEIKANIAMKKVSRKGLMKISQIRMRRNTY